MTSETQEKAKEDNAQKQQNILVDKNKLIEMLKSNADSLKGMSIKLSGKAEALEELVKLIVNGEIDYSNKEAQQAVLECSIDEQVKELKDVNIDSVREPKEAWSANIYGS